MPRTQVFLYDMKSLDAERHKQMVGVDNALILDNLRRLHDAGARIWIRIPVVSGFNADEREMEAMAAHLQTLPRIERVTLMPYHKMGREKYEQIGFTPAPLDVIVPRDDIRRYAEIFAAKGLPVYR